MPRDDYVAAVESDWRRDLDSRESGTRRSMRGAVSAICGQIDSGEACSEDVTSNATMLQAYGDADALPYLFTLRRMVPPDELQVADFVTGSVCDLIRRLLKGDDADEASLRIAQYDLLKLYDRGAEIRERLLALHDLATRGDKHAHDFVDVELRLLLGKEAETRIAKEAAARTGSAAETRTLRAWRAGLIRAVEDLEVRDEALVRSIATSLRKYAERVVENAQEPQDVVWAALRRYARLIEPNEETVGSFARFLRPGVPLLSVQAALQSLANVFAPGPPDEHLALHELRARVVEICRAHLRRRDGMPPLGVSAYSAAAVLDLSEMPALAEELGKNGESWIAWQLVPELHRRVTVWEKRHVDPERRAFQRLRIVLAAARRLAGAP